MGKLVRYTRTAMFFHWSVAVLILLNVALVLAVNNKLVPDEMARPVINFHKSTGLLVLMLVVLRLVWRLTHTPPPLPASYKNWEVAASHAAHIGLYVVALALPLSGWAHDSAWDSTLSARFPFHWYGTFIWPHISFIANLPPDVKLVWHTRLGHLHSLLATVLYVLLGAHVLGALKHQWIDKESELQRMLPWGK